MRLDFIKNDLIDKTARTDFAWGLSQLMIFTHSESSRHPLCSVYTGFHGSSVY